VQKNETTKRNIHISFDDGNHSDVAIALPMLQRFERPASFFFLTDFIDKPGFVSRDDVKTLHAAGMTIGSHGADHVRWTALSDRELFEQVIRSIELLSELIGEPINSVAVPFGAYNRRVLNVLRRLAVANVLTSDGGLTRRVAWVKARNTVTMDTPLEAVDALLARRLTPAQRLRFLSRRWRRRVR
jgi:peptidoglycan/xylan/chitin deacetylase (PgdA/CDA1 family)